MTTSASELFNLKNPVHLLATGFGSGLAKKAPGTAGTVAAIPFFYLLAMLPNVYWYIAVVFISGLVGIYLCGKAAEDAGVHDHGAIVWDEFVGLWITLACMHLHFHIVWLLLGFIYFRFFDIVKPFPISWLDKKIHGGLGIMLDDVLAGFFALAALEGTVYGFMQYRGLPSPF